MDIGLLDHFAPLRIVAADDLLEFRRRIGAELDAQALVGEDRIAQNLIADAVDQTIGAALYLDSISSRRRAGAASSGRHPGWPTDADLDRGSVVRKGLLAWGWQAARRNQLVVQADDPGPV